MSTEKTFLDTPLPGMASKILSVDVKVNTTERSAYRPHEDHAKEMKKKGIRGFFTRTCKAVKRPFHRKTRVEAIVPPLLPDTPVPCTSGLQQRPERQESISYTSPVSGPYRPPITSLPPVESVINDRRHDEDLEIVSISSYSLSDCISIQQESTQQADTKEEAKTSTNLKHNVENNQKEQEAKDMKRKGIHGLFKRTWKHGDAKAGAEKSAQLKHNVENKQKEDHAKEMKKKGIRGFFMRTCKAVKRPFHRKTRVEAIVPPLLPDTPVPCTSGLQQRPERQESISERESIIYRPPIQTFYLTYEWYKNADALSDVKAKPKLSIPRLKYNVKKRIKAKKEEKEREDLLKGILAFQKTAEQYSFKRPRPRNQVPGYYGPPWTMGSIVFESPLEPIPEPGPMSLPSLFKQTDGCFKSFYETTFDVVGVERTGLVFDGIRKSDGHKVSLKSVESFEKLTFYSMASYLKPLINEVAMICLMQQPPISPYVIRMSEWFERLGGAVLVLEDPRPCSLLSDLIDREAFDEKTARILMHQAVLAAKHCIAHGVFYAEINPRNILVNTSTWELKLTDFSCALPYTAYEYRDTDYRGNRDYASLECLMDGTFRAVPTNVWQLGLLLTELVFGCYYTDKPKKLPDLSEDCIRLILWCRHGDPERRPTFDQILQHRWFTLD